MERRPLGRSGVSVTRVALGCAPLAGLFSSVGEEPARATVDAAWEHGVRTFDTAPHYGVGLSERRVGGALRHRPRDRYTLCTKVGAPARAGGARGAEHVRRRAAGEARVRLQPRRRAPLARGEPRAAGLDRVDVAHVHDPDEHLDQAIGEALPALVALRDEGLVGAVGAGINQAQPLARIVREADVDSVLVAGLHTLLHQGAAADLLPLCRERGVAVPAAGVFNSGVLIGPRPGATFDYEPAPPEAIERARCIVAVCRRHGVPPVAAAVAFTLRHPAIASVVVGTRSPAEVAADVEGAERGVLEELWDELIAERLVDEAAVAA